MGRTKAIRQLHCHRCRAKYDWLKNREEHHPESYQNIQVYGREGDYVLCVCKTCGHMYKSRSQRAHAIYTGLQKLIPA